MLHSRPSCSGMLKKYYYLDSYQCDSVTWDVINKNVFCSASSFSDTGRDINTPVCLLNTWHTPPARLQWSIFTLWHKYLHWLNSFMEVFGPFNKGNLGETAPPSPMFFWLKKPGACKALKTWALIYSCKVVKVTWSVQKNKLLYYSALVEHHMQNICKTWKHNRTLKVRHTSEYKLLRIKRLYNTDLLFIGWCVLGVKNYSNSKPSFTYVISVCYRDLHHK